MISRKVLADLRVQFTHDENLIGNSKCLLARCLSFSSKCGSVANQSGAINEGPLNGIRILDLSRILAGPFCTMVLGDLGAEIIKVEKPGAGDETRSWAPPYVNGQSCYFVSVNRNKKSVALDLKKGKSVMMKLVSECDVLVENFIPGTMEKLGLGYDALKEINSKLIYCSISGYGASGPYKHRGGYDVIAASLGGLMHITGERDGDPCKVGVAMTDLATGLYAHGAIMAAIIHRGITNKGQKIDCNLLSTQISCLVNLSSNYLNAGLEANRWGTAHESIVPYQAFQTKDNKWITIGTGNTELFYLLCDKLGLSSFRSIEKFSTNELRVENRIELLEAITNAIKSKNCKEWLEIFESSKFPYGPVNDMKSAFEDPQVQHNKMVQKMGAYSLVGPAVSFGVSDNRIRSLPPTLGEHTKEVLSSILKLSNNEIKSLYENGTVQ